MAQQPRPLHQLSLQAGGVDHAQHRSRRVRPAVGLELFCASERRSHEHRGGGGGDGAGDGCAREDRAAAINAQSRDAAAKREQIGLGPAVPAHAQL
eukprot:2514312-Pleurochrysis_carterae.AAC.4